MPKKIAFEVTLRRVATGEEHKRLMLAADQGAASAGAIERARARLESMADRTYAEFQIVSCVPAAAKTG